MRYLRLVAASALLFLAAGCNKLQPGAEAPVTQAPLVKRTVTSSQAEQIAASLCSAPGTYERLKVAAFRQAAQVRGTDSAPFDRLAAFATIRVEEPLVVSAEDAPKLVRCTARVAIDLPPGTSSISGARSLTSDVAFSARMAADGTGLVWRLSSAEPIIYPLATLRRVTGEEFLPAPIVPAVFGGPAPGEESAPDAVVETAAIQPSAPPSPPPAPPPVVAPPPVQQPPAALPAVVPPVQKAAAPVVTPPKPAPAPKIERVAAAPRAKAVTKKPVHVAAAPVKKAVAKAEPRTKRVVVAKAQVRAKAKSAIKPIVPAKLAKARPAAKPPLKLAARKAVRAKAAPAKPDTINWAKAKPVSKKLNLPSGKVLAKAPARTKLAVRSAPPRPITKPVIPVQRAAFKPAVVRRAAPRPIAPRAPLAPPADEEYVPYRPVADRS